MGIPLIWVEWGMGRYGGQLGHHSTPGIFQSMGRSRLWKYAGVLGLWVCLIIAAYYLYIESWCLAYAGISLFDGFHGTPGQKAFWILQHQRHPGHNPYVTTVVIERDVSGSLTP